MKMIVRLRWLFIGMFLTALMILGASFVALSLPALQVRFFEEPAYLSLFSRSVAENIHETYDHPAGVYPDEELIGCSLDRNQLNFALPFGVPQGTPFQVIIDPRPEWEVRYSKKLGRICTMQGNGISLAQTLVAGSVLTQKAIPNKLEFSVGDFNPNRIRSLTTASVWELSGVDLRSVAFEPQGPAQAALARIFPSWDVAKLQKSLSSKVRASYQDRAANLKGVVVVICWAVCLASGFGLGLVFRKSRHLSRSEEEIVMAKHVGGSAPGAVALAGKMSVLRFLCTLDLAGYIETIGLRQREALAISKEWLETMRGLVVERKEPDLPDPSSSEASAGSNNRRDKKVLAYRPREQFPAQVNVVTVARLAATQAIKVVAAEQSLKPFCIPRSFFPEGLPELLVVAAVDILKTLLAGWGGGACFGERRMDYGSLERRVRNHQPQLKNSPQTYDKAVVLLKREGMISVEEQSRGCSVSIASRSSEVTELGKPIHRLLVSENQRRKGFRPLISKLS